MSQKSGHEEGPTHQVTRRNALTAIGGITVAGGLGLNVPPVNATAPEPEPCTADDSSDVGQMSCGSWPLTDSTGSEIVRNEFGYDYRYRTSVGSYLTYLGGDFVAGKWSYYFLTQAHGSGSKKNISEDGDPFKPGIFDGNHHMKVEEKDHNSTIATQYISDADWGYGVTEAVEHNYSWADATMDSVKTLESQFNPVVDSLISAIDIIKYWKKASHDDDQYDGIDASFSQYQRTTTTGQYIRYFHRFPPQEEFSVNLVDFRTTQEINNTLFVTNGTEVPNGDYKNSWDYSIEVKPSPNSLSKSERRELGIVETQAKEALNTSIIEERGLNRNDTIYIDKNPIIKVR